MDTDRQASLGFTDPNDHAKGGAHLNVTWNVYEDNVYLFNMASYTVNTETFPVSMGITLTKIEENRTYEIKSLGVTARLVSGLIEQNGTEERQVMAFFCCDGISYDISAMPEPYRDVTLDWPCKKLETLHK